MINRFQIAGSKLLNQYGAQFNGSDEYATKSNPSFKGDTAGGISFWFYLDALFGSNGADGMLSMGDDSGANNSVFFIGPRRLDASTGPDTYMAMLHRATNGATFSGLSGTTTPLTALGRNHCLFDSNGSTWTMTINGVAQTLVKWSPSGFGNTGDWFGDVSGANHTLAIGAAWNAGAPAIYFDGRLDEIVYKSGAAFTAGEKAALYNGGTPINPHRVLGTDMKLWTRCGDSRDDAATMYDESENGNDFALVNMDASNYVAV